MLAGGQHWISYPESDIATETGALLHFKFTSQFPTYARTEAARREHAVNGRQYQEYARGLDRTPDLCLYDPQHSVRLSNSAELVALGVMTPGAAAATSADAPIPRVEPILDSADRPFWSVMLTVFDRVHYLERALRSVLEQDVDPTSMQIEVVHDGGLDGSIRNELRAVVAAVGDPRVSFHGASERLGHPHIFNYCIARARGQWVHLLHDDDWIEPGYYTTLRPGIESSPEIGLAFCRWRFVNERGAVLQRIERDTAGVIDDWVERIAISCRIQMPAAVVRRSAYERLGGFWPAAGSAFDWEMWKRLAVHYKAWYEPSALASFRQHNGAESHHLVRSGGQIADSRRTIELSRRYLPADRAEALSAAALEHYASWALTLARRQLASGDARAAFANIREALACSRRADVVHALVTLLSERPMGANGPKQ